MAPTSEDASSALLVTGPWLLVVAAAAGLALLFAWRVVLRRRDSGAARGLVATEVFGAFALLDFVGLTLTVRGGNWSSGWALVFALGLLLFLIGFVVCGGYTAWRMIATVAPRTPSDPPPA